MSKSKDEYLMLREEILQLYNLENNVMNFFYVSVTTILAFSFIQQDTIFVLLPYIIIIPSYKLVLSKIRGVYKAGSYLYVFQEGELFNWERRSLKFIHKIPNVYLNKMQSFNYPFLMMSIFITVVFIGRTEWKQIFIESYELIKGVLAIFLFGIVIFMVMKNRRMDISCYITYWEEIKKEEERGCGMIKYRKESEKCNYGNLENKISKRNPLDDFRVISGYIDNNFGNDSDKIEQLEAMICYFEGELNKSNSYTIIAIAFSIIVGLGTLISTIGQGDKVISNLIIFILGVVILIVCVIAIGILKSDYKKSFILKSLNFKLEEIKQESNNKEYNAKSDYKEYIVKIRAK